MSTLRNQIVEQTYGISAVFIRRNVYRIEKVTNNCLNTYVSLP